MTFINKDAFAGLRRRVCAIGVLKVSVEEYIKDPQEPKFKIFGTGFLIGPLLVLTNRHVLQNITAYIEKESLPKNRRHVAFLRPDGFNVAQSFHEFEKMAVMTEPHNFDVGLISFRATEDDPIRAVTPVVVPDSFSFEVGDPIGVYGYAFGEGLLKREVGEREMIYRFGPILQQGYISGIAPFDHSQHIERVLLDVRTARGMSGSPVFDPRTGCVHALHTSGIEDTVAFGIPISSGIVTRLVEISEQSSSGDKGTTELKHVSRGIF
jgi:hypothetical protein